VIALRGERRFGAGDAAVVHVTASVGGCPLEPLALGHDQDHADAQGLAIASTVAPESAA
jgi:hypothetical protein